MHICLVFLHIKGPFSEGCTLTGCKMRSKVFVLVCLYFGDIIISAEEQKKSIMQEKLGMRHYDTVKVLCTGAAAVVGAPMRDANMTITQWAQWVGTDRVSRTMQQYGRMYNEEHSGNSYVLCWTPWSYLGIEGNTVLSVFCNGILLGDRRKGRQYSVLGDTLGHKK